MPPPSIHDITPYQIGRGRPNWPPSVRLHPLPHRAAGHVGDLDALVSLIRLAALGTFPQRGKAVDARLNSLLL